MVKNKSDNFFILCHCLLTAFFLGVVFSATLYGQNATESAYDLGTLSFPKTQSPLDHYVYDTEKEVYIYVQTDGNYPLNTPLVLTPKEYQRLLLKEQMNTYFKDKVSTISQKKGTNQEAAQRDLLPELYVNSKFF